MLDDKNKIFDICKQLYDMLDIYDKIYIEEIIQISFEKALEKYPYNTCLLAIENIVSNHILPLVMLYRLREFLEKEEIFIELGIHDISFQIDNRPVKLNTILKMLRNKSNVELDKLYKLYLGLFIEEKEIIKELINKAYEEINKEDLRDYLQRRFKEFFEIE